MNDKLLNYYKQELTFIRKMGVEFAKAHPKIAGRLLLEPEKCEDPHTERLIEAFAFISGRIHKKLDDDSPEITEALLGILYPHYINPIPSMSVVKFEPIKQNVPINGYSIDKGTKLYSKPSGGVPCQFRTCQPVKLWPVEVTSVKFGETNRSVKGGQNVLSIQLKTYNKVNFAKLNLEKLRFFLNTPHHNVYHLYELLFNNVCDVECESRRHDGTTDVVSLSPANIEQVGFNNDERMLPYSRRSFPGYLLLFEYFCFPQKFLFFDLSGFSKLKHLNCDDSITINIYLNKRPSRDLIGDIDKETFCLNATPVVNLFNKIAEPIRVERRKSEYRVIPAISRQDATEIFSINEVLSSSPERSTKFGPFYSMGGHLGDKADHSPKAYWLTQRRPSGRKGDNGTEVFLSFANLNSVNVEPEAEILTIHTTCSNRDMPARLPFGDPNGDFDMEINAPVDRINCLIKPTPTCRPPMGAALQWRLISHLSLNYLSLVEGGENAFKEILTLYDFDNSPFTMQQISGITSLQSRHVTERIGRSFCRGLEVSIEFDRGKFVGEAIYLFASVLERFLGQYVSVNSFSQLLAKTIQKKEEVFKKWEPRSGSQVLL